MKITPQPPSPKRINMIIIVGLALGSSFLGEPISNLIRLITGYERVQSD